MARNAGAAAAAVAAAAAATVSASYPRLSSNATT